MLKIKRGDIYWVDYGNDVVGSEQGGVRPAIIISNKLANMHSPVLIACPTTTKFSKKELPTHVELDYNKVGLEKRTQVLAEQMGKIDRRRIMDYIGTVDNETMDKIDLAIEVSTQVGRAKNKFESREIKIIKEKVESIRELDKFIQMCLERCKDIQEELQEREIRIKELEKYALEYGLNYRNYYKPVQVGASNLRMMVG